MFLTNLNIFRELLIKLLVVLLIFCQFSEEFQALFDQILPDNFQNFALLQHLTGNVQREILRIHHTSKCLVSLKKLGKGPGPCEPERTEQPQGWDVGESEVSRRRKVEPQMAIKVLGVCKDLWEGVRLPAGCVMRA